MRQSNRMKNKIISYLALAILLLDNASAEKYYSLSINHYYGYVAFNSNSLKDVDKPIKYNDKSGFLIKTISFEGLDLGSFYYDMTENRNYIVYVPYRKDAEEIIIYNANNSIVMEINVASFADTCGNNICEPYESYESCTGDCTSGSKDDFCDGASDGICDPDCSSKTDNDCDYIKTDENNEATAAANNIKNQNNIVENVVYEENEKKPNYLIWILPISAIAILVLMFLFYRKIRENQIINLLKQYINENLRRGFSLQQIKGVLFREGYDEKEIDKAIKSI